VSHDPDEISHTFKKHCSKCDIWNQVTVHRMPTDGDWDEAHPYFCADCGHQLGTERGFRIGLSGSNRRPRGKRHRVGCAFILSGTMLVRRSTPPRSRKKILPACLATPSRGSRWKPIPTKVRDSSGSRPWSRRSNLRVCGSRLPSKGQARRSPAETFSGPGLHG
jgi:hypothetical protein